MLFHLSRPSATVRATRATRSFSSVSEALGAVDSGRTDGDPVPVVGAISFAADSPDALYVPADLTVDRTPPEAPGPVAAPPGMVLVRSVPSPSEHRARVGAVVDRIRAGEARKVVLARSIQLTADIPVDVDATVAAFAAGSPERNAFAVDLSAAGVDHRDTVIVGSSPESLVRKHGRQVTCHPYAGSAPRSSDPETDRRNAAALLESGKDHREHRFVVEHIATALGPLTRDLRVPDEPVLIGTGEMWHLASPIEGTLIDTDLSALHLAVHLHPTPAICGTPTDAAAAVIGAVEEPRGFYAGALGWCDTAGDGEWMVSIRGVQVSADRRSLRAWSGGGIVADSDPADELAETTAKFGTVLRALGCPDLLLAES
ncbi:isochorismate synthase [Williamsia deligens]|uniref:Isochorismate synthase MenF n=1 Tax=Williamsia deligens TaxID=321325 RepID=A0ABW3G2Q1_9NOCA|nr:chorismate-binding protein [Williamsia deligens]MCP2194296.1 isochorismate synthase [Williamsia deligens]